ncbi:hypothetical protein OS493_019437 [Desmophyllum pertusum]|uniref:Uncharacterized protein n=1 Tax=Desmophyllum pertusum TaxID=174260 RepID=A0A9X0DAV6_9CNID|nr:hypothetical protein OS493_019437 [Desmophyllum pertusum]
MEVGRLGVPGIIAVKSVEPVYKNVAETVQNPRLATVADLVLEHPGKIERANTHICSGDKQQKIISAPDKPTRVFIGDNVSLVWQYNHPNHFTLCEVVFGIQGPQGDLTKRLVAVNASGFPDVRKGYESKLSWAGN